MLGILNVYFLLTCLAAAAGVLAVQVRLRRSIFFFTSFVIISINSLAIGLRGIGVTSDTKEYVSIFRGNAHYESGMEPIFRALIYLLQGLLSSPTQFLVTFALIINGTLYFALYRISRDRALLLIALFGSGYAYWLIHFQVMRNGLAAVTLLVALSYYLSGNRVRSIILSVISVGIHFSAVIPFGAFILSQSLLGRSLKYIVYSIIAAAIGVALVIYIASTTDFFTPWLIKIDAYEYYAAHTFKRSQFGLQHLYGVCIIMYFSSFWGRHSSKAKALFIGYASVVLASLIFWDNILYRDRIFLYAQLLEPVLIYIAMSQMFKGRFSSLVIMLVTCLSAYFTIFHWGPGSVLAFK